MALPWLESLPVWGYEPDAVEKSGEFPKRFGVQFMACGVHPDHWWGTGEGDSLELSKSLKPLEPLKPKINVSVLTPCHLPVLVRRWPTSSVNVTKN